MNHVLCGNKDGEVFIVVVILGMDMDFVAERQWQILWSFELLFICQDLDGVEFEHPIPLPLCYYKREQ